MPLFSTKKSQAALGVVVLIIVILLIVCLTKKNKKSSKFGNIYGNLAGSIQSGLPATSQSKVDLKNAVDAANVAI